MENFTEDLGEQVIAQLRELIRILEIKFGKKPVFRIENAN